MTLGKRSQTQKATYGRIPFIQNVPNRHPDRESRGVVAKRWGKGEVRREKLLGKGIHFAGGGNVLK